MTHILDEESSAPLYQQVMDHIKTELESGTYPPETQIPPELELARSYGVGRITVRRAIEELVNEGYLTRKQGKGTFVMRPKMKRKIVQRNDFQSFTDACGENGMKPGARVVSRRRMSAGRELATYFRIAEEDEVICISRVRTADGVPILLENNYYPYVEFSFLETAELTDVSIFELVGNETGHYPMSTSPSTLEIARACVDEAHELEVPVGEPLFYLNVGFQDEGGRTFCFGRQYYVGSRYSFDI